MKVLNNLKLHVMIIPSWYPEHKDHYMGSFFREQAIGMVVLGVKSPLVQFTGVLQELYGQFARVLHAVAEQKQS